MKIQIKITTDSDTRMFSNAVAAMKYLKTNKAIKITLNNEPCPFRDICELYQLELKEKRHNETQGVI